MLQSSITWVAFFMPGLPLTCRLINCPDAAGWTALHYAVCTVHEETTATLLSCGANIIARTLKQHATFVQYPPGSTALHIAAAQGNLTMIIQILRAHVRVCCKYGKGMGD